MYPRHLWIHLLQMLAVFHRPAPFGGAGNQPLTIAEAILWATVWAPPERAHFLLESRTMAKSINPTTETPTDTTDSNVAVLDAAAAVVRGGTSLKSPKISKANRKLANKTALVEVLALGLGAGAEPKPKKDGTMSKPSSKVAGHGSICRQTVKMVVGNIHGSETVRGTDIDPQIVINVLSRKDFATQGKVALKVIEDKLAKSDAERKAAGEIIKPSTLASRAKNIALTNAWLKNLGFRSYMKAVIVLADLGSGVTWSGGQITLSRAMGLAFGRGISAAELANDKNLGFVNANA
jgi:hypothetical protein